MIRALVLSAVFSLVLCSTSLAALIDFELTPAPGAVVPTDDASLTTPYPIPGGNVRFFFDRNANLTYEAGIDDDPIFEIIGTDGADGFVNQVVSAFDIAMTPAAALQLGNFFLRGVTPGAIPPPFVIDYNVGVAIPALSGEIWDIDGSVNLTELWRIDVLDAANTPLLPPTFSPLGDTAALDSLPWTFAFTGLPAGVDKVVVRFIGTKPTGGVGLAFNNFSPTEAVPEPGSITLLATGAGLALAMAARRRWTTQR